MLKLTHDQILPNTNHANNIADFCSNTVIATSGSKHPTKQIDINQHCVQKENITFCLYKFLPRDTIHRTAYAVPRCLSVRPSVTRRYSDKMARQILKLFTTILVFSYTNGMAISD